MAARERAVVQAFTGDGPILVAIHDVLADLHDLLDARLPKNDGGGPVRISEPAPDRPPAKAAPVAEPAPADEPDGAEDEDQTPVAEPAPNLPEPPPRAGRGSSAAAWTTWAGLAGVTTTDGASRDDIINACQSAGVLPES